VKIVLIPCIYVVYRQICLKIFLIDDNEVVNESMCCHVTGRSCNCLFRLLQKVVGCALALSDDFLL